MHQLGTEVHFLFTILIFFSLRPCIIVIMFVYTFLPPSRAIKSLETSLGVSADSLTSPPLQLVRAPAGPPSWTKVQRRPHAYEPVSDSTNSNLTESSNQAKPKQLITSSTIEMDWDETELKSGLTKVSNLSQQRAASQPNLLKDSDVVFPHLKRPARVSEEAFKLRQTRLLNHKYEKMEKGEESVTFPQHTESVGDVITSTGTSKQCWTEGGEGELPKGWQTMRDESKRVYYWHVPSGKTQYERPTDDEIKRLVRKEGGEGLYFEVLFLTAHNLSTE